jgi:catechol 2,3-dioxygenase-like lactoylglutathione lyase family enzyme
MRLDLVGLVVDDLAASLAFYRRLGLPIPEDAEASEHGHVEAQLPGLRLAWDTAETIRSFDPDWTPPTGGQRIGLAFLCDTPAEVDAKFNELVEAGYPPHKEPWDAFWGQRYAQIKDPDGNAVDLFAPLDARSG